MTKTAHAALTRRERQIMDILYRRRGVLLGPEPGRLSDEALDRIADLVDHARREGAAR